MDALSPCQLGRLGALLAHYSRAREAGPDGEPHALDLCDAYRLADSQVRGAFWRLLPDHAGTDCLRRFVTDRVG